MNGPYRATLVSKGNTLESPYNGNGLVDVTKVGEDRSYLMKPRFVILFSVLNKQSYSQFHLLFYLLVQQYFENIISEPLLNNLGLIGLDEVLEVFPI